MAMRETADLVPEPRWLLPTAHNTVPAEPAAGVGGRRILAAGPVTELRQRFAAGARRARAPEAAA